MRLGDFQGYTHHIESPTGNEATQTHTFKNKNGCLRCRAPLSRQTRQRVCRPSTPFTIPAITQATTQASDIKTQNKDCVQGSDLIFSDTRVLYLFQVPRVSGAIRAASSPPKIQRQHRARHAQPILALHRHDIAVQAPPLQHRGERPVLSSRDRVGILKTPRFGKVEGRVHTARSNVFTAYYSSCGGWGCEEKQNSERTTRIQGFMSCLRTAALFSMFLP